MPRPTNINIRTIGLEKYLNDNADVHNGFGYLEFSKMADAKVGIRSLARAFKTTAPTMTKWLQIYKEQGANNASE